MLTFFYCMSVFIAVFVLAGQHRRQDNQWGGHRRRQPDLIRGVCTGQSWFDNIVYITDYLSHWVMWNFFAWTVLVVSLLCWNDSAPLILIIVINSEASSKEIGNVLTVFYYGRLALVSMTTTIQLLLILRLNMSFQAMERVDVEQKMSIRFLHWFLNFLYYSQT